VNEQNPFPTAAEPSAAPAAQFDDSPRPEVHLSEYWAVIVKRRHLIALVMAIVLIYVGAKTLLTKPTYRSSAVINIEKNQSTPFDVGDGRAVYQYWEPEYIPTQMRLLQSREIIERAVDRLNLTASPEFGGEKPAAGAPAQAKRAADLRTSVALNLQGSVDVQPIRGTNLVTVSYEGPTPKLAADVPNAIADAYIDWTLESKFKVLGQAGRFLSTQSEQLKSEIDALDKKLQAYGRSKDIVSTDPEQNVQMQSLGSLNKDYADAVADRVAKEARYNQMQNSSADSIADTTAGAYVSGLRGEQARLEREYAEKLNLYKPEWPAMQQLKAQIDKGRQHVNSIVQETVSKARESARNDYLTARRREDSLKAVLQGQKNDAMQMNSNAVEYNNLKVEIDTKKSLLDALLKRQAETELSSRLRGERISSVRVVDRALPATYRFRPSYKRNGMMGLFCGAIFGLALAFFLEYLDRSLRTPNQVEQFLRLPALGIIPAVGTKAYGKGYGYGYGRRRKRKETTEGVAEEQVSIELVPHHHPRSTVAEAYRAFRTALLLSRAGGVHSLTITSSLPGEGKTSTAANLAIVLGQINKKVLLIDADLHKPRQHKVFGISNRLGLVSILAEGTDPLAAVTKTALANVYVLPAGPSSPNPSGLLSSVAMTELLRTMNANFDYVIIDSPPVGPVADAIVLGHYTDGVVLTTQAGRTPRVLVRRVRDKLQLANVRILGVLINNLQEDPVTYEQYYKYYGDQYTEKGYTTPLPTKRAG
jgi:capsular exopolysaccharide synthesis family protein